MGGAEVEKGIRGEGRTQTGGGADKSGMCAAASRGKAEEAQRTVEQGEFQLQMEKLRDTVKEIEQRTRLKESRHRDRSGNDWGSPTPRPHQTGALTTCLTISIMLWGGKHPPEHKEKEAEKGGDSECGGPEV